MSNYNSAATNYGSANVFMMMWTAPESLANLSDNSVKVWCRFTGLTAALAGTVSQALLTISGIGAPGTSETITVKGDKTSADAGLPVDFSTAMSRTVTSASVSTTDLSAVTTVSNLDITSVVQEVVAAIDGSEILLVLEDLTYSGSSMTNLTVTLDVTYSGSGGTDITSAFMVILSLMGN